MAGPLRLPRLRPLPITIAPFPDETVDSYLGRLARADRLRVKALRADLFGRWETRVWEPVPVERLAILSGQPARTLRYAILELCTDTELAAMHIAGRLRPATAPQSAATRRHAQARLPVPAHVPAESPTP